MSVDFTIATEHEDGSWYHGACDYSFNLANANASMILRAIGLPDDPCGSADAEDVLARCATFRAVGHAVGRATEITQKPGRALIVSVGRPPEYVHERIGWLEKLAEYARANGYAVGWS